MYKAMLRFGAAQGSRLLCIGRKIYRNHQQSNEPRFSKDELKAKDTYDKPVRLIKV
jgi:hypothetical protein